MVEIVLSFIIMDSLKFPYLILFSVNKYKKYVILYKKRKKLYTCAW